MNKTSVPYIPGLNYSCKFPAKPAAAPKVRAPLVETACNALVHTAGVVAGIVLLFVSLGLFVGVFFCHPIAAILLLFVSFMVGISGLSAMWVGFGRPFAKK